MKNRYRVYNVFHDKKNYLVFIPRALDDLNTHILDDYEHEYLFTINDIIMKFERYSDTENSILWYECFS